MTVIICLVFYFAGDTISDFIVVGRNFSVQYLDPWVSETRKMKTWCVESEFVLFQPVVKRIACRDDFVFSKSPKLVCVFSRDI